MARTRGPATPRWMPGNLPAAASAPSWRASPRKTSQGSRKRTRLMFSRLPPRRTPTTTPARSRTKARSTGEGYRRCLWARSSERLPSGEPRFPLVPEVDGTLAESPAQVDLPTFTDAGEVDQPLLNVAHHDA